MSDNPFSEPEDNDRTVLRGPAAAPPQPGAMPQAVPPAAAAPRLPGEAEALPRVGPGPLAAAAAPLLDLLGRLSTASLAGPPNPEELRERALRALRQFEAEARGLDLSPEEIRAAHYALCASLDDVVLATPWGAASGWSTRSLVSSFHQEVRSGERFFDLLTGMLKDPGRYRQALEVASLCLSLGMAGKYRLDPRGRGELDRVRESIAAVLAQLRGPFERELSPRWRGVDAPHRGPSRSLPAWVAGAVALALLALGWSWLGAGVNAAADDLSARLAQLPPGALPEIARTAPPVPPAPPPPPPPQAPPLRPDPLAKLREALAPEIQQQLVSVEGDAQRVRVRIQGAGMFPSGSAALTDRFGLLMQRIGEALRDEEGRVLVLGHSDNQPIRTARFPSSFALSQARAEAVLRVVRGAEDRVPERFSAEGRADQEPIASNATAEGREANRRIEIVLLRGAN